MGAVATLRLICLIAAVALSGVPDAAAQFIAADSDEDDIEEPREDRDDREASGMDAMQDRQGWLAMIPAIKGPPVREALTDALRYGLAPRTLYSAGFDLWRGAGTIYGSLLYSGHGPNADGFIFKGLFADGAYAYRSGRRLIRGGYVLGALMPGWRWSHGTFDIKTYAGIDFQSHRFLPDDRRNRLRGNHTGLRAGADMWWEPQPWMMVATSLSASSIGESYRGRFATGLRIDKLFWLGPEAEIGRDDAYRQHRFGLHLTGFRFSSVEWTVGAGYLSDSDRRSGYYGRVDLGVRIDPVDPERFPRY